MKILIYSTSFYPAVGGVETVVLILAHEFVAQGQEVKIVTQTAATDKKDFSFEVIRQPPPLQLLKITNWCDIYFQVNISLKGIWPLLIHPRPWVISHNGWYIRSTGSYGWQDYLKQLMLRFATGISVSKAVAEHVGAPSTVIPNPYTEDVFYPIPEVIRDRELVFLGRLVSDKGVDLLLEALANLQQMGLTPRLTIIGPGPEKAALIEQAKRLNIMDRVEFTGAKVRAELAQLLNAHQIMVVPSRCQEGFGVVVLEGIACGCVVVGSQVGGLPEAIGKCGETFPNEDVPALTQILFRLLQSPDQIAAYRENAKSHVAQHTKRAVAKEYLKVFERVVSAVNL